MVRIKSNFWGVTDWILLVWIKDVTKYHSNQTILTRNFWPQNWIVLFFFFFWIPYSVQQWIFLVLVSTVKLGCVQIHRSVWGLVSSIGPPLTPHWYDIVHFGPKPSWICSWVLPKRPHTNGVLSPTYMPMIFSIHSRCGTWDFGCTSPTEASIL